MGGVIYSDSADKAARFIMNCNQQKIPLVFFQDVSGFMVGSRSEHGGIIKDGAKMVNAMANSVVPKFTFIVGNSYGAGNYAMCGKAYDPRLIYAWPTAQMAVMSGAAAGNTLLQIQEAALKSKGFAIGAEEKKELLDKITKQYMDKYGINNVRGGSFVSVKLKKSIIETLEQMNNGTNDKCFSCMTKIYL
jgi:acetyl-CoA carboxylase carboxyltransferase component